jgi:hypothetical protein
MGPNNTLGLQLLATALARLNKKRLGPCPHIEVDQDPPRPRGSFTTTSLWGWLELRQHQRGAASGPPLTFRWAPSDHMK